MGAKAPHAVLSEGKETTATHFSGPAPAPPVAAKGRVRIAGTFARGDGSRDGPTWEALDGSRLTGARVASAAAPDGKSIPWLLLRSTSSTGPGLFGDVTWVQRLDTVGGGAPAGCDGGHLGAEVMVPYRADYFSITRGGSARCGGALLTDDPAPRPGGWEGAVARRVSMWQIPDSIWRATLRPRAMSLV